MFNLTHRNNATTAFSHSSAPDEHLYTWSHELLYNMKYEPDPPKIFTGNSIRSSTVVSIIPIDIFSSPTLMPPAGDGWALQLHFESVSNCFEDNRVRSN